MNFYKITKQRVKLGLNFFCIEIGLKIEKNKLIDKIVENEDKEFEKG